MLYGEENLVVEEEIVEQVALCVALRVMGDGALGNKHTERLNEHNVIVKLILDLSDLLDHLGLLLLLVDGVGHHLDLLQRICEAGVVRMSGLRVLEDDLMRTSAQYRATSKALSSTSNNMR